MTQKKENTEQSVSSPQASRLERDLAGYIDNNGFSGIRALMQELSLLEHQASRFYIESRPACNSELLMVPM